ncbi:MAG: efflux RND transporter periplasmic adaptor subunit, partial [Planctomycetota bacterium]|nr:efflux RND transporter periplasmic adaptor subunit [Planctomycetota bacterium]
MSEKNRMRSWWWIAGLAVAFALGFLLRGGGPVEPRSGEHAHDAAETWTCSMHPQVRLPEQGRCPICGMDLIPLSGSSGESGDDRVLELDAASLRLARVRTEAVRREAIEIDVPMVGKVDVDETRLRDITAYVPGRIERMYVDYTGVRVQRGDHLVDLYSPELVATQEELIQAVRSADRLEGNPLESLSQTARRTVVAAREKLRLLGMNPSQIERLERSQIRNETITFYSPIAGVVLEKHANQGAYVQTGTPLYTLASLDRLWIRLDAYESDLEWLRLGQAVRFEADAFPGETFEGRITFIDPLVDPATRTTHVRMNVRNPDGRLKPG